MCVWSRHRQWHAQRKGQGPAGRRQQLSFSPRLCLCRSARRSAQRSSAVFRCRGASGPRDSPKEVGRLWGELLVSRFCSAYAGCQARLRSEELPEDCDLKSQGPEAVILVGTTLQSRGRLRIRGPVQLHLRLDAQRLVLVCCTHSQQIGQNKVVWPFRREVFDLRRCRCGELGSWGSDEWRRFLRLGSEDEGFKRHCRPAFPRISTAWRTSAFPVPSRP